MKIPYKIRKLTALALQDRVLTFKERGTIVVAALKEGMKPEEIREYIDEAIRERLKNYTKEELTHCPFCGAQVPLISEDCLFCGKSLHKPQQKRNISIAGPEAEIIKAENKRTERERLDSETCPDCGAPFPLFSNVCFFCGRVLHQRAGTEYNIKVLLTNIRQSIAKLRQVKNPSFFRVFFYRFDIIVVYFLIMFMALNYVLGPMVVVLSFLALFIVFGTIVELIKEEKKKRKAPVQAADDEFFTALYAHEMYLRQIETIYGGNAEARKLLSDFWSEIKKHKKRRNLNRNIITLLILAIMSIPIVNRLNSYVPDEVDVDISENPYYYSLASYSKELAPLPEDYADTMYVKTDKEIQIMIDVGLNCTTASSSLLGFKEQNYVLRTAPIKMDSDSLAKTRRLQIRLWDQNFNPVGGDLGCLEISESESHNLGKAYYGVFLSQPKDTCDRLKQAADSAFYYSIH